MIETVLLIFMIMAWCVIEEIGNEKKKKRNSCGTFKVPQKPVQPKRR